MASAAIWDALETFLETDVLASVNAEQPGALVAGAVTVARESTGPGGRQDKAPALSVEIVKQSEREEVIGVGVVLLHQVLALVVVLRKKDKRRGKAQVNRIDDITRAIKRRYHEASSLVIPVAGDLATFRYSEVGEVQVDTNPDGEDIAVALVPVTFSFTEELAAE